MKSPAMKSPIWTIFRKEVLENLRDRKTVMNALIVGPLLGPVLFAVMISTMLTREMGRADKPLELPVIVVPGAKKPLHATGITLVIGEVDLMIAGLKGCTTATGVSALNPSSSPS